jgi:hypothetical protein
LDNVSYPATKNNIKQVLNNVAFNWIQAIYDDTVFHNPEVTFVYVSTENKFGVFHSHTKVIPPGGQACDAVTVGLLSDKINGNVAGKIEVPMASNPFNRFFFSIAPIDRIKSSGFDVIEAVTPDVIHKPDGTSTNTNAELGFPGAMDEGLPALSRCRSCSQSPLERHSQLPRASPTAFPLLQRAKTGGRHSSFGWNASAIFLSATMDVLSLPPPSTLSLPVVRLFWKIRTIGTIAV